MAPLRSRKDPGFPARSRFPAAAAVPAAVLLAVCFYFYLGTRAVPVHPEPVTDEPGPGVETPLPAPPPLPSGPEKDWTWPEPPFIPRPEKVKGIYVPALYAGGSGLERFLQLVNRTELNAMVIDTKDDWGRLTYPRTVVPWAVEAGAAGSLVQDPATLIARLAAEGVYPIARIVAFKDSTMAQHRPDLAIQRKNGGLWRDWGGNYWLDPYNRDNWKYLVALAREAAEVGFREIQFDYVRFPSDGNLGQAIYPAADGTPFNEVIPAFLRYARASLAEYGVELSADIFGMVTTEPGGMGIGQQFELMAGAVDLLCPMVYPSHYEPGNYGLANPDAEPYRTVYNGLYGAVRRLERAGLQTGLRPWLQAFTLEHPYRAEEIRAQITAAADLGIEEFLLWNPGGFYISAALLPAKSQ